MKRFATWLWSFCAVIGIVSISLAAYQYALSADGALIWQGRTKLLSPADDKLAVTNHAGTVGTVIDHTGNGAVSVYALNGSTAATWTFQHVAAAGVAAAALAGTSTTVGTFQYTATVLCNALPATTTAKHVYLVSDASTTNQHAICVETTTGWKIADGSGDDCCS